MLGFHQLTGYHSSHTWDGTDFVQLPNTRHRHWGALGSYQGRPFITMDHDNPRTEILDMSDPDNLTWEQADDYPYYDGLVFLFIYLYFIFF